MAAKLSETSDGGKVEILRLGNMSVGRFDERNYYVAEIKIGGKGAKDEGEERLEKMCFYPVLHTCLWKAATRVLATSDADSLKKYAGIIEKMMLDLSAKCEKLGEELEKQWRKAHGGKR